MQDIYKFFFFRHLAGLRLLGIAMLLIGMASTQFASAAQVQHLATQSATATGAGAGGTPSIASFNIPSGKNRVLFIWPTFERDHCSPADGTAGLCANSNGAGTGLGDNYPEPRIGTAPTSTSSNQLIARVVGPGGTINKQNALIIGGTPSGDTRFLNISTYPQLANTNAVYFSLSSFHIVLFENEINTLLNGAASGTVSIALPDVVAPTNAGDDAMLIASVFQNVEQTVNGFVRNATATAQAVASVDPAGNFTMSVAAYDAGQIPLNANDGKLVMAANSSTEGFVAPTGHTALATLTTTNAFGTFDTPLAGLTNEPNGVSGGGYFRNGGATPGAVYSITAAGAAATRVWGGTTASFLLKSDNSDVSDAPISYGNASHTINGIRLGAAVDADATLLNNATATGDDANGTDDEDGVTLASLLPTGETTIVPVNIQNGSGFLNVWFDWNGNGNFNDPGEQMVVNQAVAAGIVNLNIAVPATALVGPTFARFRVCSNNTATDNCSTPTGTVQSGEVEDYQFNVSRKLILRKTTVGGVGGAFGFALTNTAQTTGTVTTTVANTATQVDGATANTASLAYAITSPTTAVTINENTLPAGWSLAGATCVNAANTTVGSLSGSTYTITGAEVAASVSFTCTFTNVKEPPPRTPLTCGANELKQTFNFTGTSLSPVLGPQTFTVGTGSTAIQLTVSVTGSLFDTGSPSINQQGGFTSLRTQHNSNGQPANTNLSTTTVAFSRPVNKVSATSGDVDAENIAGNFYQDTVTLKANGSILPTAMSSVAPGKIYTDLTTGTASAIPNGTKCDASVSSCNVITDFDMTGITSISQNYKQGPSNAPVQGVQSVSLGNIEFCTPLSTVETRKVTANGVGGPFNFTSTSTTGAFAAVTTTAVATPVSAGTATINPASTSVTIVEAANPAFALTGVTCTAMGASGAAAPAINPGGAGGSVTLNAAALASGANPVCTFTNTKVSTLSIIKTASLSNFVVGKPGQFYTITVNIANGPTTAAINLADSLPTGITLSGAPTIAGTAIASCPTAGGTLAGCSIAAPASGPIVITVPVNVAASATSATNTATVTGGGDPACPTTGTAAASCTDSTPITPVIDAIDEAVTKQPGTLNTTDVSTNDPNKPAGSVYTQTATTCTPAGTLSTAGVASYTAPAPLASCTVTYKVCPNAAAAAITPTSALCDTAVLTINSTAFINPVTESGTAVAGTPATPIANIRSNDSVNGVPATATNSTIAVDTTSAPLPAGMALNTTTGAITTTAATPPGVYPIIYKLCDLASPTPNCATVTDTVTVTASINAVIDPAGSLSPAPIPATGGTTATPVTSNDKTNGNPVVITGTSPNATLTVGTITSPPAVGSITLSPTTGLITVAPGTTPGTYSVPYTICTVPATSPTATCSTTTATVVVAPVINPVTESGTAVAGTPATPIANIRSNDSVNGVPATATNSTIAVDTTSAPLPAGMALNTTTGAITTTAATPPGVYPIIYKLCDLASPTPNCATVTDTVTVSADIKPTTESGTAFEGTPSTPIANVAANDTVNGVPAILGATGNSTVAPVGTYPVGVSLNPSTGAISTSALTPAGVYNITYKLCDKNTPVNCKDMVDMLTVSPPLEADVSIQKTGPALVINNGAVVYTLTIRNAGPGAANGASYEDLLPTGLSNVTAVCSAPSAGASCAAPVISASGVTGLVPVLPVGGSVTITINAKASASGLSALTNTATVSSPAGMSDPNPANNTSTVKTTIATVLPKQADLSLLKTGPSTVAPNGTVTYLLTITNAGPGAADAAQVSDIVPAAISNVTASCLSVTAGASCSAPTITGNTVAATIATLPASATVVYQITGTAPAGGGVTNTAAITPPMGITDPNPKNNTSTTNLTVGAVTGTANISVIKTGNSTVAANGAMTYSVVVSNAGPDAANGTQLNDAVPDELSNVAASCASTKGGAVCAAPTVTGNLVTATLATLPANSSVTFTIAATAPALPSRFSNSATAVLPTGLVDPNPTDNVGGPVITQVTGASAVSGNVYRDTNRNVARDANEPPVAGVKVTLRDASGKEVVSALTDSEGNYMFPNVPAGKGYSVVFVYGEKPQGIPAPTGTSSDPLSGNPSNLQTISGITVVDNNVTTNQNARIIDPSGVVYDSVTRLPVTGATVCLAVNGNVLPNTQLAMATPNCQVTGAGGAYTFFVTPTAPTGTYSFQVAPAAGYLPPNAVLGGVALPSSTGFNVPVGFGMTAVQNQVTAPTGAQPTIYHLQLNNFGPGSNDVIHNHIPLDAIPAAKLTIAKTGSKTVAEIGDSIVYTLTVKRADSAGAVLPGFAVMDTLPAGFTYMAGTASVDNNPVKDSDIGLTNQGSKPLMAMFINKPLSQTATITISYRVRLGVGAAEGTGINRAVAKTDATVNCVATPAMCSNEAQFKVRVTAGVFTPQACVIGKVFADCNQNGIQDNEEMGIPGVKLYLLDGTSIITDVEGKYSVCDLKPQTNVVAVDRRTMPRGSLFGTTSNRNALDGSSLFLDLKKGEMHRADFSEASCSNGVIEQVKARRAQGEVRAAETESGNKALKYDAKPTAEPVQTTDGAKQPTIRVRQ
jgi:uncharacterized repeat protein (TIGR01451 family)